MNESEPPQPLGPVPGPSAPNQLLMVLVVDDEAVIREYVSTALGGAGYKTMVAANGQEALRLFHKHAVEIDLLLTDVVMPSMDGISLAKACRQMKPQLPVLFMSVFISSADGERMAGTKQHFIHKPINLQDLIRTVQLIIN
jgi:two-component system cell cycle sensor histidine kinase/response regulator CckA